MKSSIKENRSGITLPEMLIAAAILIFAIAGLLLSYITCLDLSELSKNASLSLYAAQSRIEEIKNTEFDLIVSAYHQTPFDVPDINAKGVSYVDDSDPEILSIIVSVSWRQPNGRVIGEDQDLDGQIDVGEDVNGNGILDSMVVIHYMIYNTEA